MAKSCFKQNYCHDCHTRLADFFPFPSCCVSSLVIQSPVSDVAVLSVSFFSRLACEELWFKTGVKDELHFTPIHKVVHALGLDVCNALPSFHALTGYDSTSGIFRIGKKALVRQRKQKSDSLPLTLNSLFHHLERSNYQTFVWKHSLEAELSLTSPAVSGWKSEGENLEAVLMSKEPAPK